MSAANFADAIATLLASDAIFQAALTSLLGVSVTRVLRGNRPIREIPSDLWPCFILEQGPGNAGSVTNGGDDADGLVIGGHRQGFVSDLEFALLWKNNDREAAFAQRSQLPTLFAQLLLRNPSPGVALAFLQSWSPDQAVAHPQQILAATIRGEYTIPRS